MSFLHESFLHVSTHPNVKVHESTVSVANLFQARNPGTDEVLGDTKPVIVVLSISACQFVLRYIPSLHVGLAMLLIDRVIEFEGAKTSPSHKQERDVLNILHILLVGVLKKHQRA